MRRSTLWTTLGLLAIVLVAASQPAVAQFYEQHNLISDGVVPADLVDPLVVNAWGLVAGPTSPWWISDNETGRSTIYNVTTGTEPFTVTVPGNPTGIVFNGTTGFVVDNGMGPAPARFLFASEDGTISAWHPVAGAVPPATVVVDSSASGAVYKGLATASTEEGEPRLYATDFHNGKVDVFDGDFGIVEDGFKDPTIPEHYAPFGIQAFGDVILVTYALQDADALDDVPGEGHGYVNMFDTEGNFLKRVTEKGQLNSPWGLALAPDDFGKFSGHLLVGNFGNGRIHAFDPTKLNGKGEFQHRGPLHSAEGIPVQIDGLWGLSFGNGGAAGPTNTLFFTAGPDDESHGLFGSLVAVAPPGRNR